MLGEGTMVDGNVMPGAGVPDQEADDMAAARDTWP